MLAFKKLGFFLLASSAIATAYAGSILSITPTQTTLSVRSDGMVTARWTVTNNSSRALSNIQISPTYQTTGQPSKISLQNNTCSSLSANGSCTFDALINGAMQPNSFQVTPRVCVFGNMGICSYATTPVVVSVTSITNNVYAYISTYSTSNASLLVPINTANSSVGNALSGSFSFYNYDGVAVSKDGSKIYEIDFGNQQLHVFSGGNTPALLGSYTFSGAYAQNLALTPDGKKVYVSDYTHNRVFILNVEDPSHITATSITDSSLAFPFGLVASPDGSKIYVLGLSNNVSIIDTATDTLESTSFSVGTAAWNLTISPNGQTLYIIGSSNTVIAVNANTGSVLATTTINDCGFNDLLNIGINPDGSKVFVSNWGCNTVDVIDTATAAVVKVLNTATNLIPSSVFGLGFTPDGSKLIVTGSGSSQIDTLELNNNYAASLTTYSTHNASFQIGNFVG
ncbi:MAG: YncE family protein [Gammaproteobacteria bacterium]|nr:YncE family protein [Gammaproteobacteria bacterium]